MSDELRIRILERFQYSDFSRLPHSGREAMSFGPSTDRVKFLKSALNNIRGHMRKIVPFAVLAIVPCQQIAFILKPRTRFCEEMGIDTLIGGTSICYLLLQHPESSDTMLL